MGRARAGPTGRFPWPNGKEPQILALAVALPIGLLIGLSLGALGGGDSILTVPTLVHLLGQDTHAATTGSLLIVGVTVLAGMAAPLQSS